MVTKLDQLGRSVRNLKQIADDLQTRQVGLRLVSQGIDTTTRAASCSSTCLPRSPSSKADLAKAKGWLRGKQPKLTIAQEKHLVEFCWAGQKPPPKSPPRSTSPGPPSIGLSNAPAASTRTQRQAQPHE